MTNAENLRAWLIKNQTFAGWGFAFLFVRGNVLMLLGGGGGVSIPNCCVKSSFNEWNSWALTVLHSQAPQLHIISFREPALMHCEWDKIAHDQSDASYLQCDSCDPGSDFRNSSVDWGLYQILLIKIQTLNSDLISLPLHFESYLSGVSTKNKAYKSYNSTKNWFQRWAELL